MHYSGTVHVNEPIFRIKPKKDKIYVNTSYHYPELQIKVEQIKVESITGDKGKSDESDKEDEGEQDKSDKQDEGEQDESDKQDEGKQDENGNVIRKNSSDDKDKSDKDMGVDPQKDKGKLDETGEDTVVEPQKDEGKLDKTDTDQVWNPEIDKQTETNTEHNVQVKKKLNTSYTDILCNFTDISSDEANAPINVERVNSPTLNLTLEMIKTPDKSEISPTALVNEAIASAKSSSMKKRVKGIMGENKSKRLKSDDENEAYDKTLTEQVNMYRALSADICHLEKYVAKAKS